MPILDNLLGRLGFTRNKAYGPGVLATMVNGVLNGASRPEVANMREYLGRYADQAWVYACVGTISSKGAGVPIGIYRRKGSELEEVKNHPLEQLLKSVNNFISGYDLMECTLGYLGLTGNAYWLLDAVVDGKPTEIYPLNPARVKVRPSKTKYIAGYTYEPAPGVEPVNFAPEEILHFKTWNPLDDYYGMPPIAAARDAADSMLSADRYNKAFFENSAEPGGLLTSDTVLQEGVRKRIEQVWKTLHQGSRKAHRIGILEGGMKWQSMTASHKDMQFPELKRMTREDIIAVYHLPPIMVGVFDEANYANAEVQRRIFWEDTMLPILSKILSVINERLVKPYDESVEAAFKLEGIKELQPDEKIMAEKDEVLVRSGIIVINEARAKRKLPPVPWGDTWNAPMGIAPIDEPRAPAPAPGTPAPEGEDGEDEEDPPKKPVPPAAEGEDDEAEKSAKLQAALDAVKAQNEVIKQAASLLRRESLWLTFKGFTEDWEKKWKVKLARLFREQKDAVLSNMQDAWEGPARQARLDGLKTFNVALDAILFDGKEARKIFRLVGRSLMESVLQASGKAEADKYDLGRFTITEPRIQKWLDEKAFKFAEEVNKTTEDALREALKLGLQEGDTIDEISKRVADIFDMAEGYRSERIARTETVSSANRGAIAAYEESGVVKGVEWITARDADVRDSHKIDGEIADLGQTFSNGLLYPGDPSGAAEEVINCRCSATPVLKERD